MKNYLLTIAILLLPILLKAQSPAVAANKSQDTSTLVKPTFPGGAQAWWSFLAHNIRYPATARQKNVQGQVLIEFIIEEDGSLTNFKVLNSPADDLTAESLRVLALSPKWTPGTKDGKPVRVSFKCPINFTLGPPVAQKPSGK